MKAKLRQISGPGIEGLQECPPCFHVDFDRTEFKDFLSDPAGILKILGYAIKSPRVTLCNWDEEWSHKKHEFVKRPLDTQGLLVSTAPVGCCYVTHGEVICHVHEE